MVAAVKLFKVEEEKESQPASASQGRWPHAAGCDSFDSSISKSLTAGDRLEPRRWAWHSAAVRWVEKKV